MKGKMAIVGDGDSILAFKAGGIETFPVANAEDAKNVIKKIAKDYYIIFIIDTLAKEIDDFLLKYRTAPYPAIVSLPSKEGSNGYGMDGLKREMDRALGVDILFKNGKEV